MAYENGGKSPKKPIINQWTGEGIVRPRSNNDGDEIKFFPFQRGGGAIHFSLACTEEMPGADPNGQPKTQTAYIPVNVMTNKNITEDQLKSVVPGMRVRVVGRLAPESYTSKRTNAKVTTMSVSAFVFEILAMPAANNYGPQGGYASQSPYPQQGIQYSGQYPPQGGYPGPQGSYQQYGPQGGYQQYGPQGGMPYPPAPGYPQPGGYPAAQPQQQPYGRSPYAPQTGAPAPAGIPPYYIHPGQGGPGPQGSDAPPPNLDDFPPDS